MNILASALVLGPVAVTSLVTLDDVPAAVRRPVENYERCLYRAIDRQFDSKPLRLSEPAVLASCAHTRRFELTRALSSVRGPGRERAARRKRIEEKFAGLDESVWVIAGHIGSRRGRGE